MTTLDHHIGRRIREKRVALGLSLSDMQAQLDIPEVDFLQFERGQQRVPASQLVDIGRLLGVSVGHFFDGFQRSMDRKGS